MQIDLAINFTKMNTTTPWFRHRVVLLLSAVVWFLAGCTTTKQLDAHVTAYTYSTFDFSGSAYSRARKYCDARGHTLRHVGTDCGFFLCVSTFDCSP